MEGDKDKSPTQEELEVLLRAAGAGEGTAASGTGMLCACTGWSITDLFDDTTRNSVTSLIR